MARDRPRQLVAFLQRRTGGTLRAVVLYDAGSRRPLYVRSDADVFRDAEAMEAVLGRFREENAHHREGEWESLPGDLRASVRVFSHAVIVNLPLPDGRGVVISLDLEAASSLGEFVADCHAWLETEG